MISWILWGASGHAKVVAEIIALSGGHVVACIDNDASRSSPFPGVPIFHGPPGFAAWRAALEDDSHVAAIGAIGGANGAVRLELLAHFGSAGLATPTLIHPRAWVAPDARIGPNCQILANATISADVTLGAAVIVNTAASVDHECCVEDGTHIGPGATLCGLVRVGRCSFIGAGAVVLPRVTIGTNAVIGAGAVVTRNVSDGATVVGNPARIVKESVDVAP